MNKQVKKQRKTRTSTKNRVYSGKLYYNTTINDQLIYDDAFEYKYSCTTIWHENISPNGYKSIRDSGYMCREEDKYYYILDICHHKEGCYNTHKIPYDTIKECMEAAEATRIAYTNKNRPRRTNAQIAEDKRNKNKVLNK